ncbi:ABC transporter ATP-binding protein [Aurantiacibacter rhizosphaerae]|uniref:ATP-binding cassette domain-containing protein n=1 Tax=Aurantiacibacter rhizosphaerae TaxID=2691582 RepID=A0A844XAZ6_9SPHN|nr:ABC transporter ATP-binding protein [Aurantiacibacter rhizosphaerae]MWV26963.1 ATP-binding cassette domain-containing protein [Aurantiacibacter rhizosphaerae]
MGLRSLLLHAWAYRKDLALIIALSMLGSAASLSIPWLAARLLGGVIEIRSDQLALMVVLLIVALIIFTGLRITSALVSGVVGSKIEADFREDIYAHVQRLPLGFFDHNRQGDLLALLTWEVSRLSAFLSSTLTSVPAALMTGAGALVILFVLDPLLAFLLPVLLPLYYVTLKVVGRRLRTLATQVQQAEANVFAIAEEDLEMLPAIKAFAREKVRLATYRKVVNKARRLKIHEQKIYAVMGPTLTLITSLAAVVLLLFAYQGVVSDRMSMTELFSFLFYATLLTGPVGSLADLYGQLNSARGTLERLHHVLREAPEPGYANARNNRRFRGWITFSNVWFSYRDRDDTLRDLNLEISAGEIVALVGDNGAGKSTIVKLLLGFYLPREGEIRLDGTDVRDVSLRQLRRSIGYVPQRPLLHNGTVKDNLVLGLKDISEQDVERACRLAQAHDFITRLPKGYATRIGDHGVRLSGGQRQRIALARALLSDPPILVLDEATSMYDLEGEAAFVEACQNALLGRTVILITHRPASLALADRILTISDGEIVGEEMRNSYNSESAAPSLATSMDRSKGRKF